MSFATVKLRNGSEEAGVLVVATMLTLNGLWDRKPIAVYELVMLCRDSTHKPFGTTGADLKELSLASEFNGDWRVHGSTRNIVLSAVRGEGIEDMTLGNPVIVKEK